MINLIARPLLFITLILTTVSSSAFYAQDTSLPPPPVDIDFTTQGTPQPQQEIGINIKLTPKDNLITDISCILPEGILPLPEEGKTIILRPWLNNAVELYVGPLKQDITQEFNLRFIFPDKGKYRFTVRIESFEERYGAKEETFVIEIN